METTGLKNGDASSFHNGGSNPNSVLAPDPKESGNAIQSGVNSEALTGEGSRTFTIRELLNEMKEDGNGGGSLESETNKNVDRFVFCALQDSC